MSATWNDALSSEVQALALTGYDLDCALHLLLTIDDGIKARALVDLLLGDGRLRFGEDTGARTSQAVNIGFTYRGLCRLGLPQRHLDALQLHAPAFCEGATSRAARRLGDAGASAADCWEDAFAADRADVLISIHGCDSSAVKRIATELSDLPGAKAFSGWDTERIEAAHLDGGTDAFGKKIRDVHFGLRDNLARPGILARHAARGVELHEAGELLLGHANDPQFNRWATSDTVPPDVAAFFRNGSFAVFRRIEQNEGEFNRWLKEESARLIAKFPHATETYLKAKLCGRWPNGALLRPGQITEPALTQADLQPFDFLADTLGKGCPFGAHIRRTNPRSDEFFPRRLRPLFRRGMPYGPRYAVDPSKKRGLVGLFFCASIEDQFEHLLSEWVEKRPMGPPNRGTAKDPLIGNHDEPAAEFHIPQPIGDELVLGGASGGRPFARFVRTRGTLYALFPGRYALAEIGRLTNALPTGGPPLRSLSPMGQALATGSERSATTAKGGDKDDETLGRARAPADRFCDLVMEGGVTSGIIYAAAVVELSKAYRFRSIGGSSIGAFAAAAAAAAEYRRRNGSMEGFRGLAQLPTKLAEEDRGKALLQRLFRSQDSTRRLFAIFLSTLGYKSKWARFSHGLFTAIRQYWRPEALAGVLLALIVLAGPLALILRRALASPPEMVASEWIELLAWLPAAVATMPLALLAGIGIGVLGDVRRGLVPNGFGLCRGWTSDDDKEKSKKEKDKEEKEEERSANEADSKDSGRDSKIEQRREPAPDLTGYLHATIQTLAGRNALDDPPLTFKDLWTAPGSPMEALGYPASVRDRSINLEVYATNLAHGRPYRFPGDDADDMGRLFFCPEELQKYFPKPVLQHLMAFSVPYEPKPPSDPPAEAGVGLRELPGEHLPIVVATRLALSFPLLISAVPLWAIDYEPRREERKLERCWFSDGGLCSNFPIHLFDSFIPKWPTFGISLHKRGKYREKQKVWLPEKHFEGRGDTWDRGLDDDRPALQRLGRFVLSMWLATWRWNDMTSMRMPGVRDRVVRVMLREEEGGVNIKMSGKQILALANDYGKPAAKAFIRKFAAENSAGWAEHRWVRLNRLLIALREQINGISFATSLGRHATTLQQQLSSASGTPPLRGPSRGDPGASEKALRPEQLRELESLLVLLSDVEQVVSGAGDHQPFNAVPRPSLRIRHPT